MARGWESKSVEMQQDDAARRVRPAAPALTDAERARLDRRRSLELARARTSDDLARATTPAHRQMLERTLAALDAELAALG